MLEISFAEVEKLTMCNIGIEDDDYICDILTVLYRYLQVFHQ